MPGSYKITIPLLFIFCFVNLNAQDLKFRQLSIDKGMGITLHYPGNALATTLMHLSTGRYVPGIMCSDNDPFRNEDEMPLSAIIKPPWWSTWWAYILYGFFFISAVYLVRRYELSRIRLRNQLKLEKIETESLRKLDQLKSHFFTNISHEFRTPLTLILGQIEHVLSSDIDSREKDKLQIASRNASRLLTLINQLLELSKLEAGSMKLDARQQNIVSFLKSLFFSFESIAALNKINLRFESEPATLLVSFDTDKLEKIFYNLLSNALKYTPQKGEICVFIASPDEGSVNIHVRNTGKEIPAALLPHIFDRFFQAESPAGKNYESTGIGLALTRELVELHNGSIEVRSREGEGSEFILTLPVSGADEPENLLSKESSVESIIHISPASTEYLTEQEVLLPKKIIPANDRKIILIVEDHPDVRSYIREQLDPEYNVMEAEDGLAGISAAQRLIPDLIITDVMMPNMDGCQLCTEIRKDEKTSHIPVIMLTARAGLDDKIEGLETGADDYLLKPFSAKELKIRVKNLIASREALRKRFSKSTVIRPSEVSAISVDQAFLEKAIRLIEAHFPDEQFSVDKLAAQLNMSISQLNRKLNALVDQPAGQLIRSLRLQRAADLLRQNAGNVAEVCFMVGFNDQAYFSRSFRKQFGCSPSAFRREI